MTQREGHTSAGVSPAAAMGCVWEELFQSAAPGRQQQLLALAGREGVLYAHELPPANNGAVKRSVLPTLLNGQIHDVPLFRASAVECSDARLDETQREAVARALQTPDICLIQGRPGSGKSRTAVEIAAQAAARGERVLLLGPTASAVDCVLERLDGRDGVCAVRCLSRGEGLSSLPAPLRRLTFEERLRSFHEQTLPAARQAAEEAARRCASRRDDEAAWAGLEELATRLDNLPDEMGAEAIEAEADGTSPYHRELAACRAARDGAQAWIVARLAELCVDVEKARCARQASSDEIARLTPLTQALNAGRWWTLTWWRARRESGLQKRLEELQNRHKELTEIENRLRRELDEQTAERAAGESRFREEVALLQRREKDRRQAERAVLEEQVRSAYRVLCDGMAPPEDLSAAAVQGRRATWSSRREQDEREAARTAHWVTALENALAALPERLARCVNVVAAVTSALAADPHFGDNAAPRTTFDLLVLEESHFVTESEFLAVARRARRWVLIGEPADDAPRVQGLTRPNTLRPGFFQRLWRLLHCDPSRLPYDWFHREDRLVCRLRPASADEEQWIASEYLADRPEIELRIASPPRTAPRLVEVVFPGATPICEAKSFIFRELGELPLQAHGGGFRWKEDADRLTLDLSDGAAPDADAVDLADGVRERIAGNGLSRWQTCSLEFARGAGWTRDRAEQWVEERLQTRDLGRTVSLNTPYRGRPALARFLSALLFDGACPVREADDALAVEFVPVPSLEGEPARRRPEPEGRDQRGGTATATPRARTFRAGAGLESDLADPRPLDPLPAELRAALPCRGLINWFEARAIVRKLENLVANSEFQAAAQAWAVQSVHLSDPIRSKCASPSCSGPAPSLLDRRPALAVMALYPAQAELIRLLVAQSPALTAAPLVFEVGTPDLFRQRECFTALIGLTRSHSHRAVPFGDDPSLLPTGLTRAASRVILFGDPGTMARRCQWNGAVDHLDEAAGERERGLIARLMAYLHGHGTHPSTFSLDESGRL
jgi:AAA domain